MAVTINGTTGISLVQDGTITATKLASGVGGKILQVVQATSSTQTSISSGESAVEPAVSITPSSTSSNILIMHSAGGRGNSAPNSIGFAIKRGSTVVWAAGRYGFQNGSIWAPCPFHVHYLDSPSTTSEITYTPFIHCENSASLIHNSSDAAVFSGEATAVTIAMEISG